MNKFVIILLCLLCLGTYANSLNSGFIFDDKALIVNNPFVKSQKLPAEILKKDIFEHWVGKASFALMYRPMQVLSYWLDYKIWGLKTFGFHLTNIILHLLNGILIYLILLKLFSDLKLAAIASFLFIVHPLHVSVVSYISGRADLLSLFFILLTVLLFLNDLYTLSVFSGIFALFSRENALVLLLLIALMIVFKKAKKNYLLILPFIFLDLLYLALRLSLFGFSGMATHGQGMVFSLRILNCANIGLEYVFLLIFPFNLHFFRVTPFISGLFEFKTILIIFLSSAVLFLTWRSRKNKIILFGFFWFLIGLIPAFLLMDGFLKFNQAVMAESWIYPASAGFFLIASFLVLKFNKYGLLICAALILYFGSLTIHNNYLWKDDITFDKNTLKYMPEDTPLRRILIDDYLDSGFYKEALSEINELSRYYGEDNLLVIIEMGNYYFFTKNPQKAIECYNNILVKSFLISYREAECYKMLGKFDEARSFARASVNINPYYDPAKNLLKELGNGS